MSAVYITKR